jgi:hypothetical protein
MKQNIDGNILIEDLKAETNGKRWLIKKNETAFINRK